MRFPPEIVDHILSFLQWDCATLNFCAQAHPTLSKLVERHIYAHITIDSTAQEDSDAYYPSDLCRLILDNPDIAKHVRTLRLNLGYYHGNHDGLECILPELTRLEAIFLSPVRENVHWDNLPESIRTAFTNYLRLPTLTDVKTTSIIDATGCRNFHHLPSVSSPVYPPLDSLCFDDCRSVEMAAYWIESRSFRSLDFSGKFEILSLLLPGVSANILTDLKIHIPPDYGLRWRDSKGDKRFTPIPFSLACLPHLTHLTIKSVTQLFVKSEYSFWHDCLPSILDLLESLPSPPTKLVQLLLDIGISLFYGLKLSEVDWSALVSFPYFDVIPHVELRVCAWTEEQMSPVEVLKILRQDPHLMRLEEHHSFLINAVEESVDHFSTRFGW